MNINSSRLCPNPNPNVIRLLSNCFPFFRKQASPPLLLEDLIESRRIEIKNPAFSKRRRREADRSFHSSYVFRVSFVPRVYIDNGWWMLIEINDLKEKGKGIHGRARWIVRGRGEQGGRRRMCAMRGMCRCRSSIATASTPVVERDERFRDRYAALVPCVPCRGCELAERLCALAPALWMISRRIEGGWFSGGGKKTRE